MPSLHNIDRFLATHIADSRNARSATQVSGAPSHGSTVKPISLAKKDDAPPATLAALTAAAPQAQLQLTLRPKLSSPVVSAPNGKNVDSGVGAALKKFFTLFLGSAADYKAVEKNAIIKAAREVMVEVQDSIQALRVDMNDGAFKKIVIDSFNGLSKGKKPTFLQRCKEFLDWICEQGGDAVRNYPSFQLAKSIHEICAAEVSGNLRRDASPAVRIRDFSPSPSNEEIAELLKEEV